MIQKNEWIGTSIIALIITLSIIGYNITDKSYYCSSKGIAIECSRFSKSGLRCYPNLLDTKGYRDCPTGWIKLSDYNESIKKDKQGILIDSTKKIIIN